MPCSRSSKVASNSFLAFPNRSIAAKESAPHRTASKAMTSTLTSGCARVRSIRGSDTSERYSITDALISFCSSLIVISWTRFGRAQEIMRRGHAQAVLASDRKRSIFDAIALAGCGPDLDIWEGDRIRILVEGHELHAAAACRNAVFRPVAPEEHRWQILSSRPQQASLVF